MIEVFLGWLVLLNQLYINNQKAGIKDAVKRMMHVKESRKIEGRGIWCAFIYVRA